MAEIDSLEIKITANTAEFDKAINNLGKKMKNISGSANTKGSSKENNEYIKSLSSVNGYLGKVSDKLKKTTSSFGSYLNNTKKTKKLTDSLASSFGKFYASCFLLIRGFKGIGNAIKNSMDYIETYNYFIVSLNKVGKDVAISAGELGEEAGKQYTDNFKNQLNELTKKMTGFSIGDNGELIDTGDKSLGLDPTTVMNFQAKVLSVTNSVGLLGKTSTDTAEALTMLAGDLSSLTNQNLSDVMNNLQSGLIGQSRALYKFGIDITSATLSAIALEEGITKSVSAMSQSEKMQLRMIAILRQSKVAWGDLGNTVTSSANQYRIFSMQISNLSKTIGNLFLPIVQKVLPFVNGLTVALNRLLSTLGMSMFGDSWLTDLMKGTSTGNVSGSGIEDLEEDLDNATSSAKKLKNVLLGIDELNVIDNSSSGSGSSAGGAGDIDLSDSIGSLLDEYKKTWERAYASSENIVNRYADSITKALQPVYDMMDNIFKGRYYQAGSGLGIAIANSLKSIDWDHVYSAVGDFGKNLASFLNGLISPNLFSALAKTIAGALNTKLKFISSFGNEFDWKGFGDSIGTGINSFFSTYNFGLMASSISTIAIGLLDSFISAVEIVDWEKVGRKIGEFLANIQWGKIISKTLKAFTSALGGIADAWGSAFTTAPIEMTAVALGGLLLTLTSITPKILNIATSFNKLKTTVALTGKSFDKVVGSVGSIATKSVGVVGLVTSFVTMEQSASNAYKGLDSVGESIKKIGLSLAGSIGSATMLFGIPAGILVGGALSAVSAIKGVYESYKALYEETKNKSITSVLVSENGISFEDYAKSYTDSLTTIVDGFDTASESIASFNERASEVGNAYSTIDYLKTAVVDGKTEIADAVPQIESIMGELSQSLKDQFDTTYDLIYDSLSGSVRASLEANGVSVPALIELMNGLQTDYDKAVDGIQEKMQELSDSYSKGGYTTEEYYQEMLSLSQQLSVVKGDTDEFAESTKILGDAIDGIDFSGVLGDNGKLDTDLLEQKIGIVTDAYETSTEKLDEWLKVQEDYFNQAIAVAKWSGDDETANQLSEILDTYRDIVEAKKGELTSALDDFSIDVQTYFLEKVPTVMKNAENSWEDTLFAEYKSDRVADYLDTYKKDVIEPITESMTTMYGNIGKDVSPFAEKAMDDIVSGLYSWDFSTDNEKAIEDKVYNGIETALSNAKNKAVGSGLSNALMNSIFDVNNLGVTSDSIKTATETIGTNFVEGFNLGVEKTNNQSTAVEDFGNESISTLEDALETHSPSKATERIGNYFVEGFQIGIENEFDSFKKEYESMINVWMEEVDSLFSADNWTFNGITDGLVASFTVAIESVKNIWNTFADGINDKLKLSIPENAELGIKKQDVSLGNIPKFALGGFPEDGLFYANHNELVGQFSNGKTAVANNEQIVDGIRYGVRSAVAEVMTPYLTRIADNTEETAKKEFSVAIGDRDIARANRRGNRSLGATIISQS